MKKRLLATLLTLCMVLTMLPTAAFAADGDVAQIGDTTYATLDEAVEAAEEGATIELLQDCELTKGFNKTLTFTGTGKKITINKQLTSNGEGWMCFGLYDPTRVLTFDGVEVEWNSEVGTAPWLMLSLSGTLNVTNGAKVRFTVDSGATGSRNAIYMNAGSSINVSNGSTFEIYGYDTAGKAGQALQLDQTAMSNINVTGNSTFVIDGTNRGYVNSPNIYVEDSTFIVRNCTSNGSNGGDFKAVDSTIVYEDNAGHGLSAGDVILQNSTLTADHNGLYGVFVRGEFLVDNTSKLTVTNNSYGGDYAGLNINSNAVSSTIKAGAEVTITDNYCSGLSNWRTTVFEEGAKLTITGNYNDKGANSYGGGIYNDNKYGDANLTLPSDAVIYNNHADTAGDDIYNTGTISFGPVGSNWSLDGTILTGYDEEAGESITESDGTCTDKIDGWYDDSTGNRWSAHSAPAHADLVAPPAGYSASGLLALKAAHGLEPLQPGDETGWEVSKSKTATNLDENYESQITLSLPAASYKRTMDVVFVIDDTHAGSQIFYDAVNSLLDELAEKDTLDIKIGVVAFDAVSRDWLSATSNNEYSGLVSIRDNNALAAVKTAIETQLDYNGTGTMKKVGATNTEWPVDMAKNMLDQGTGEEQYLIMFSDLYGYVYRGDLTLDGTMYHDVPLSKRIGTWDQGSLSMGTKYNTFADAYAHKGEADDTLNGFFRDGSWDSYWTTYQNLVTAPGNTIAGEYQVPSGSYSGFEKSLVLTYDNLLRAAEDAHVILVNNSFPTGDAPSAQSMVQEMLDTLEDNSTVKTYRYETSSADEALQGDAAEGIFDGIREDLIQLVDAGTTVEDYMGYVADDYNFYFVNDVNKLTMKVGGVEYKAVSIGDNQYGFAPNESGYDYTLTYVPGNKTSDEHFVWTTNVAVTKDAPVQLIYSVKLVNPKTAPGTYGTYDADGSQGAAGLYTNNKAILTPVDSNGDKGLPEAFPKPTVSYTVDAPINSLTISKTVNGTTDPNVLDDEFTFTVQLPEDEGPYSYRYTAGNDSGKTGTIQYNGTLTLQSGETVVIDGIPVGSPYTVSEAANRDFQTTVTKTDAANVAVLYSVNAVSATGTIGAGGASAVHFVNTYDPAVLTIKPSDLTIYMGGSQSENAVVGADGEVTENASSLPTPLFYITVPNNISTDELRFVSSEKIEGTDTSKSWEATWVGTDSAGVPLYYLEPEGDGQNEVRIKYTDADNNVIISDQFSPTAAHELYKDYSAEIYTGTVDPAQITVFDGETQLDLTLSVGQGNLRVRAVEDFDTTNKVVVDMQDAAPSNKLVAGTAAITAPEGTTYTLNDTTIELDSNDIGLLFDGIIDDATANRTAALQDRIDTIMGSVGSRTTRHYQAQYLDLVDQNHGNAWVKASEDVTIYWAYPTGTNANTKFTLYHFSNLHRDGDNSGFNIEDVSTAAVETKTLTLDEKAISFTVEPGDFSPYVLVWETTNSSGGSSGGGSTSTPGDNDGPELNKQDHIAYVSGYPDGTVQPNGYITREEVATMFFRLLTDASRANYITNYNPFPDVARERWSFYSITTMNNADMMTGRTNGMFDPGANITRAEFAVVAAQFSKAQYTGPDKFSDISDHWARDYINRAAAEGWIAGYPDGTFGPERYITRAEVMALVNEVLDRAPDADYMLEDMIRWPDNPELTWYYEDVQEATNSHSYVWRNANHTVEEWKEWIPMRTYDQMVRDAFNGVGIDR